MEDIRTKAVRGVAWAFLDRAGSQGIGFIITILLARLISPAEFGLVAMASVFIGITRIFIDSGLRDSLIQKQGCTQVDYSTVFYFNMVVSVSMFVIIFLSAPYIAIFFGYEELTPIIRVLGLKPFFYSFSVVQTAIIHKNLQFSTLAKIKIPAFLVSGAIGLGLAWYGWGVWALVVQTLLETFFYNVFLWFASPWRPSFLFNQTVFKFHWSYGSRLLLVGSLGALYRNVFALIIGKFFSPAQLGYYSRADSFKSVISNNTVELIQTVSYPVLARLQNNDDLLKQTYRKIQQTGMFVLLPIVAVFVVGSASIIEFLLTAKWLPAAPILVVLMLALVLSPFNSINLNILKVKRRTDLLLRVDIINKILLIGIVSVTVNLGFDQLVMTNLVVAVFALFINNYYTNRLIGYSLMEQFADHWPLLFAFLASVGGMMLLRPLLTSQVLFLDIAISGSVTIGIYGVLIMLIKRELIAEAKDIVKLFRGSKPA